MPPKKKASEAAAPSASNPPPPEHTAGGEDAGGRTGVDEGAHGVAKSKDKTALPVGGVAGSHDDRASVDAPRPSQEAQDRQRHGTHSTICLLDPDRAGGSRNAQDQHARQRAGASEARSPGRDIAPSNAVRIPSISRSSHHSLPLPATPAEALARAQLLLDFPPTPDKIDDWRATIQSLIGFANGDTPRQPTTSQPRQVSQARPDGDKTGGGATTVHSPPRRPRLPTRRVHRDSDSTASSDPRARRDQPQVLHERQQEDARTRIECRREARRQTDQCARPTVDMHAPGEPGDLPYAVGCPAFTRELRQVQWPSTKNFKPDVPEKYDGKSHPSEFLNIYTIAVQATGGETTRSLPSTSRWYSCTCRTTP